MIDVTLENFDAEVVAASSTVPVLVDFWAPWCGPCQMMAPVFAQLAERHRADLRVAKLDTDAAPQTASQFNIRSIPTLILFRGGREVARASGALPLAQLEQWLAPHLKS